MTTEPSPFSKPTPAATIGPAPTRQPEQGRPAPAQSVAAPVTAKRPSRLGAVRRGKLKEPARVWIYGPEGVGKTSLVASIPDAILLDIDGGSGQLDIPRYPFRVGPNGEPVPGGHVPRTFAEVVAATDDLIENPSPFRFVIYDTADKLEALIHAHLVREHSGKASAVNKGGAVITGIEGFGYGRGYALVLDEFRMLVRRWDALRARRGIGVVLVGHTTVATFKSPDTDDYDRYTPRVHRLVSGLLREEFDVVAFMAFEEGAKSFDGARAKGVSTGRRLLHTERRAAWDAKSRYAIPAEIEVDETNPWGPLAEAIAAGQDMEAPDIKRLIAAELERIADAALAVKVNGHVAGTVDIPTLSRYLNSLRKRKPQEPQAEEQAGDGEPTL